MIDTKPNSPSVVVLSFISQIGLTETLKYGFSPPAPDHHAIAILALTIIALILFTRERIPLETSSLFVIAVLAIGFELFLYQHNGEMLHSIELFSGFGHEALIAVCALMIAGQGLVRTGALEPIGRSLAKLWRVSPMIFPITNLSDRCSTECLY